MDILIFVLLVIAVVAVMAFRVYLRQRRSRIGNSDISQQEPDVSIEGSLLAGEGEVVDTDAPQTFHAPDTAPVIVKKDPDVADEIQASISRVYKSFGGKEVVKDISFVLKSGEVFGLVGPNGAGKSTTIRMMMDIIKPDSGAITVFGQPLKEDTKNRIGYLPEERGLYRKMSVSDSLAYLARLKGVEKTAAQKHTDELLKQVDMLPHKDKKIGELSRGMGQIIQFLVTISHSPDLIVLDEPFAGLDPVNRMLIKDIVLELKSQGKTIILSTHMMNEVEEMCDRILMIDRGQVVLYGDLAEIKWRFRNNSVLITAEGDIDGINGVARAVRRGRYAELFLDDRATPQDILAQLVSRGMRIDRFEVSTPSLNEIFLQLVKR